MTDWQDIETAPDNGDPIIGGYFGRDRYGDVVRCWWQPEFENFISSCRQITMAAGYTIYGQQSHLHSPVIEDPTHWIPWAPPKEE